MFDDDRQGNHVRFDQRILPETKAERVSGCPLGGARQDAVSPLLPESSKESELGLPSQ